MRIYVWNVILQKFAITIKWNFCSSHFPSILLRNFVVLSKNILTVENNINVQKN